MPRPLPILEGRKFGCTRCGNCCMQPGYVYMKVEELERIAAHLELTPAQLKQRHRMKREPSTGEWFLDATDGNGCPLLTADRGCSVHPVKPIQCATFPFWPEMLDDRSEWEAAKSFCPGLDASGGQLYTEPEISAIRRGWTRT